MRQPELTLDPGQGLDLLTSFAGASLGAADLRGDTLCGTIREEPYVVADGVGHEYSLHFAFGLRNRADAARDLTVCINCAPGEDGLKHLSPIHASADPARGFMRNGLMAAFDGLKKYRFPLRLAPRQELYLANMYVRNLERMNAAFADLARAGEADVEQFGTTLEGRPLLACRYALPDRGPRPEFLVVSGMHPPEGDTYGSEGILEMLADPQQRAGLLRTGNFTVVPVANPDGFVHGLSGCNLSGQNLYWQFEPADPQRMPETTALWGLMRRLRPWVYFDLHSYSFQGDRKAASPYIKPLALYPPGVRGLAARMNADIVGRCNGRSMTGFCTFAPSTPGSFLTKQFGTITYAKFHFHMDLGIPGVKAMACDLLNLAVDHIARAGNAERACLEGHARRLAGLAAAQQLRCALYTARHDPRVLPGLRPRRRERKEP